MIVRAKTKRRLIILLCSTFLIAGAITGFVLLRLHQRNVQTEVYRREGLAAFERGDYVAAAEKLQLYASRAKKPDLAAIYRLAQACKRLPDPAWDGCRAYLERFIDLNPTENDATREARRELVEALYQLNRPPEALKQINLVQAAAEAVLAKNPADAKVRENARNTIYEMLLTKAKLLYRDKSRLEDATKAAWDCTQRQPLDVEAGGMLLDLYYSFQAAKQSPPHSLPEDIAPFFAELALKNRTDARALTLAAMAYRNKTALADPERPEAQKLADSFDPDHARHGTDPKKLTPAMIVGILSDKARNGDVDAPTALYLANLLSQRGQYRDALATMEKARDPQANPALWHNLICLLWESMRYEDVLKRLGDSRLNPRIELDLMVAKADSLAKLGRKTEAKAVIDAIGAAPLENLAKPWALVLDECLLSDHPDWPRVIETGRTLLPLQKDAPRLPAYLRMCVAQAYTQVGETQQALDMLQQAARSAPLSASLHLQLANAYLDIGRPSDALVHVGYATLVSDATPVLIGVTSFDQRFRPSLARDIVQEIQRRIPGEDHTLPLHVFLLATDKKLDEAKAVIRQSLASPTTRPSRASLAQLEELSNRFKLGLQEACEKRIEADGGYTPDGAMIHAVLLYQQKQPKVAEEFFEAARRNKAGADDLAWRLSWARYLEMIHDARAKAEWTAIASDPAAAHVASALRSALYAPSVQSDLKFRDQVIERLKTLVGKTGTDWRLARAQLYAQNAEALDPGYVKTHQLLEQVLQISPGRADVHKELARIAVAQRDPDGQLDHLKKAAELDHSDMNVLLDLATVYQLRNDYQRAMQQLTLIDATIDRYVDARNSRKRPGEPGATRAQVIADLFRPTERIIYARALLQQGKPAVAIDILHPIAEATEPEATAVKSQVPSLAEQREARLSLAQLYAQTNRISDAEKLFTELLAQPDDAARIAAAEFYASTNRAEQAEKLMKQLQTTGAARDVILAQYYARRGASAQALDQANAAVKADPKNALAWQNLVFQHLSAGRIDDAVKAIDAAGDLSDLRQLRGFRDLIAGLSKRPDLGGLMAGLLQPPAAAARIAEALGAYVAKKPGEIPVVDLAKLQEVANRYPTAGSIQSVLAIEYRRTGEFSKAADVALNAATALPNSAEMAKLAAESLLAANNLPRAREFAQKWRDLTPTNPLAPDTQLAELDLMDGKFKEASDRIEPYLNRALAEPDKHIATVLVHIQLLIRQRDIDRAASIMLPLIRKADGAGWPEYALNLSLAIQDSKIAAQWLTAVAPAFGQAQALSLAKAWYLLWMRDRQAKGYQAYRELSTEILDRLPDNPQAVELRAIIEKEVGNAAGAETLYRRALGLKPDMPVTLNNLACLISEKPNASKDELLSAADMAERAIKITAAPTYYDTLAQVYVKLGDHQTAIAKLRLAVANARTGEQPLWRMNLADLLFTVKQYKEAEDVLAPIADNDIPKDMQSRLKDLRAKIKDALKASVATTAPSNL